MSYKQIQINATTNQPKNQPNKQGFSSHSVPAVFRVFASIWFLKQWLTLHLVSSRSFSQKRAAVEKDYALVRQSSLLLVCHGAALMFVETSFPSFSRGFCAASSISAGQSRKKNPKTAPQQTEKCLSPMCQVCFLSVAGSQLPKPTRLKGPLGASRALFRFCSAVRNLQPLCEELGVVCSRPSACPTRWHRAQSAHMLLWFSTEEKLTGGFMPGWKSLSPVCT